MAARGESGQGRTKAFLAIALLAVALVCVASTLSLGCAKGQETAISSRAARASPSPVTWVKLVDVGGSLNGWNRGRNVVAVAVNGGGLRFVVTVGAAPGWGTKVARFHYWLWPETDSHVPPLQMPLDATVTSHGDLKTYDMRPITPLTPGTYELLYNGAGWYQMAVYVTTGAP